MFNDLVSIKFKRTKEAGYERGLMIFGDDAPNDLRIHFNSTDKEIIIDEKMNIVEGGVYQYIEDTNIKLNIRFLNVS